MGYSNSQSLEINTTVNVATKNEERLGEKCLSECLYVLLAVMEIRISGEYVHNSILLV